MALINFLQELTKHNNRENSFSKEYVMSKDFLKNSSFQKEENWVDDLIVKQEKDLEYEKEILSSVPKRIKNKWHLEEDE